MASGLLALLDDVALLAKVAAAGIDDAVGQAGRAGVKALGVVVDDAAVTPRYVVGLSPARELPMIWKITLGSLRNKLLILLPIAMLLSAFAPWAIMPLLMMGGLYLCFEGAEKVIHAIWPNAEHHGENAGEKTPETPEQLEKRMVSGAIRTDFILSAEIMALSLATVAAETESYWSQGVVLAIVGIGITVLVYGTVALLVKADDFGLKLVDRGGALAPFGRMLVVGMPKLLSALSVVGTAAMLWVGGGILIHGLATYGLAGIEHVIHDIAHAVDAVQSLPAAVSATVAWTISAAGAAVIGVLSGAVVMSVIGVAGRLMPTKA